MNLFIAVSFIFPKTLHCSGMGILLQCVQKYTEVKI